MSKKLNIYPSCFESEAQWLDYRYSARIAQDSCSICDDCTYKYQVKMIQQGRCDRVHGVVWMAFEQKKKNEKVSPAHG